MRHELLQPGVASTRIPLCNCVACPGPGSLTDGLPPPTNRTDSAWHGMDSIGNAMQCIVCMYVCTGVYIHRATVGDSVVTTTSSKVVHGYVHDLGLVFYRLPARRTVPVRGIYQCIWYGMVLLYMPQYQLDHDLPDETESPQRPSRGECVA